MIFQLENLIPLPMLELPTAGSSIWEADHVQFESGKSYLVEAPSGKGKTSLISVMYGLRNDYRGELKIDRENARKITSRGWSHLRKRNISIIFQGLELFDDLTGIENIQLKNQITGYKSANEISSIAEKLEIGPFLDKKCGILSFGQKQRVAIIRSLCQPFRFLLADECFSHMDRDNSKNAMELINEECKSQGAGLILTSLGTQEAKCDVEYKL